MQAERVQQTRLHAKRRSTAYAFPIADVLEMRSGTCLPGQLLLLLG